MTCFVFKFDSGKHMIQQDLLGSSNADDHGNDLMAESSRVTNQILADLQTVLEETEGNPVSHQVNTKGLI